MQITQIVIYPIKSLPGIARSQSRLTIRGLQHDRCFLLTRPDGHFLTQRTLPRLNLLKTAISNQVLTIQPVIPSEEPLEIPLTPVDFTKKQVVTIWKDQVEANILPEKINAWFSRQLGLDCQLAWLGDDSHRPVEKLPDGIHQEVSFADGYPFLLLGESSMDDLNNRLSSPVNINRFRANLVFNDGLPYEEDQWKEFCIGEHTFRGIKPCARCNVPNINQETGIVHKEPNRTLAGYRCFAPKGKIYFGMNVIWLPQHTDSQALIRVGDRVKIKSFHQ